MDSIKHKMESLTAATAENIALATSTEEQVLALKDKYAKFEKSIADEEKAVNKVEMELDDTLTASAEKNERLIEANKEAERAEQESAQVTRRKTLLEEEIQRVNERLIEVLDKLTVAESSLENNQRAAKVKEAEAQHFDEKATIVEAQLEEANVIAEESARKMEESQRKLKMVQDELDRINDKAEEFESKIVTYESKLEKKQKTLGEMEIVANENQAKEDDYETTAYNLRKSMEDKETHAEFSERTVEKLEQSIDKLSDDYLAEKLKYRDISLQLDAALNDIMDVSKEEANRIEEMHNAEKAKIQKEIDDRAAEKERKEKEKEEIKAKAEAKLAAQKQAEEEAAKTVVVPMEDVKKEENDADDRVLKQDDAPLQGPEVPPSGSVTTESAPQAEPEHEVQVDTNNEN